MKKTEIFNKACAFCGNKDQVFIFETADYITKDIFKLVRCRACGLVSTLPAPDDETMPKYYPEEYYGEAGNRFTGLGERLTRLERRMRAGAINKYSKQPGRILDIGCGRGLMLQYLKKMGWECYATENSMPLVTNLRKDGINATRELNIWNCDFQDSFFDVVSMWHVLEHVGDPRRTLDEIRRILKRGGVLVAATPNFGCWVSSLTRRNWFGIDAPRHLFHYDGKTLPAMIESSGFSIRRRKYFSWEQDIVVTAQSLLNSLGFRTNSFYLLARNKTAQSNDVLIRMKLLEKIFTYLFGIILLLTSVPICLCASAARAGVTLEIWSKNEKAARLE